MTRLMTATAITLSLTGMANAEAHSGMFPNVDVANGQAYLASTLMGTRIYAVDQDYDAGTILPAGTALDWDDIGEIGDVVISVDGQLQAIIIDVGGFLGLGEREVAVSWDAIRPVTEDDDLAEVFLTIGATEETLDTAPEFERAGMMSGAMVNPDAGVTPTPGLTESVEAAEEAEVAVETMDAEAVEVEVVETEMEAEVEETMAEVEAGAEEVVAETAEAMEETGDAIEAAGEEVVAETAEAMETTTEMVEVEAAEVEAEVEAEMAETEVVVVEEAEVMEGERTMLRTPMFEREGFVTAEMDELTTETMTGMRLYGSTDEDIGEISELIMASDGTTLEAAILDIGGFLGLGEHQVRVTMDELQILRDENGGYRAYIDATEEELEMQPEYEG